ncbi:MAG: P-loop domain-containing protein [Pontiellaceae bacterium]
MRDKKEFFGLLKELDGQPIESYQQIVGDYDFTRYVIKSHPFRVQGPEIQPLFSIRVPQTIAEIPEVLFESPIRRTALEDYLLRAFSAEVDQLASFDMHGVAKRNIVVSSPDQTILPRNTILVTGEYVELRVEIQLPLRQTSVDGVLTYAVDGTRMQEILYDELMEAVVNSLLYCNMNVQEVESFVQAMDNADRLRQHLSASGQVAFLAEGSLLDRAELSDLPDYEHAVPLELADGLGEPVDTPYAGTINGLVIPSGLTVIVGEADGGRIEIMDALAHGIYNHVRGDGREHCVTVPDAVEIISEPGRSVQNVDISAFYRADTSKLHFSSEWADSFDSQAASLVEALEAGARVLLIDEQTSCPTFLGTDSRLDEVMGEASHISLASRARQMVDELGISIVIAGSNLVAEYIPIADTVLQVNQSMVSNITALTKELDIRPAASAPSMPLSPLLSRLRWIMPSSIDPSIGRDDVFVKVEEDGLMQFGRTIMDSEDLTQLVSTDQLRAIGLTFYYLKLRYVDEGYSLREILDLVDRDISNEGLNALARDLCGNLARPRRYEVAALLNRLPTFRVSHVTQ